MAFDRQYQYPPSVSGGDLRYSSAVLDFFRSKSCSTSSRRAAGPSAFRILTLNNSNMHTPEEEHGD